MKYATVLLLSTTLVQPALAVNYVDLPPNSSVPARSACASDVNTDFNTVELRPGNEVPNHTTAAEAHGGIWPVYKYTRSGISPTWFAKRDRAGITYLKRINQAAFKGTTTRILRWGSCIWGLDEDVQKARAVIESYWRQSTVGDKTSDPTVCAWYNRPVPCYTSFGILQQKPLFHDGWNPPIVRRSTAYTVAYSMGWQRACYDGDFTWLGGSYHGGDMWGCVGAWFSGKWHDEDAEGYISLVKFFVSQRTWEQPGF